MQGSLLKATRLSVVHSSVVHPSIESLSASQARILYRSQKQTTHPLIRGRMITASIRRKDTRSMEGISDRRPHYIPAATDENASSSSSTLSPPSSISPAVLLAVATASCGAFAFGYHLGIVNGPLNAIASDLGFASNTNLQGLVVSSSLAGAAFGSLGGSGIADSLGRRKAFLVDSIPLLAGALLCATATTLTGIILGRALVGIGIGLSSALVPLYISEISPTRLRGTLGSVNQLMICVGILGALIANLIIPTTAWRAMFALSAVPAVLLAVGMLGCPESPSWLALSGQRSAAEATAAKLWGTSEGPVQLGSAVPSSSTGQEPGWREVLASRGARIGVIMFILQQFSGINAIVYFSSSVFAKSGVASGALASAAVGAVNVVGTVLAAGLMDKTGRKQLLSWSFTGMGVCMLSMALGLAIPSLSTIAGPIALVGTLGYILAFAAGAGPVPGLLVPEITAARIRGRAVALAMGSHWVCNFIIGQVFLGAVDALGVAGVYTFFAAVCALSVTFVNVAVVETKGRSLEDIEAAMASSGAAENVEEARAWIAAWKARGNAPLS